MLKGGNQLTKFKMAALILQWEEVERPYFPHFEKTDLVKLYKLRTSFLNVMYVVLIVETFSSIFIQSLTRNTAIEVASTVKALYNETESLLLGRVSLVSYCGCKTLMLITVFYLTAS